VISHVTHATSGSELKETAKRRQSLDFMARTFLGCYMDIYCPSVKFYEFLRLFVYYYYFSTENYQNAIKFIKYSTIDQKLQIGYQDQ
jgi:hypothetical protein